MIVYKYTNKLNGKAYIGITTRTLEQRHREHLKQMGDGNYFHNALLKYKPDNFKLEILIETDNLDELKEKEKYYIKKYKTFAYSENPEGYNCTLGGDGAFGLCGELNSQYGINPKDRMNIETFKQWRKNLKNSAVKGKDHRDYGKHPSEIFGEGIWKLNIEKARARWSGEENPQRLNPKYGKDNPNFGKTMTKETKSKIYKTRKENGNVKISNEIASVVREKYKTGNYSQGQLAEMFGITRGTICDVVRNKIYVVDDLGYSPKEIEKIREIKRVNGMSKPVALINTNREIVKTYPSVLEAIKNENISMSGISLHLKNQVKQPRYIYI